MKTFVIGSTFIIFKSNPMSSIIEESGIRIPNTGISVELGFAHILFLFVFSFGIDFPNFTKTDRILTSEHIHWQIKYS